MGGGGHLGSLGVLQVIGLMTAVVLVVGGCWVLRLAKRGVEDQRVRLWGLGEVRHPTSLVVGLFLLGWGYQTAAYSLLPGIVLVAVPRDQWWVLVVVTVVALGGAFWADVLENRGDGEGEGGEGG